MIALNLILILALLLSACSVLGVAATPTPVPLPPAQHVENAFQWLQTHAMLANKVDWDALRRETAGAVAQATTTADTIPVICEALRRMEDGNSWISVPGLTFTNFYTGYLTIYPENRVIMRVLEDSPAEKAGLRIGDEIIKRNGEPPAAASSRDLFPPCNLTPLDENPQEELVLLRQGQEIRVTIEKVVFDTGSDPFVPVTGQRFGTEGSPLAYVDLNYESGEHAENYFVQSQLLLRKLDQPAACGWLIDLRRIQGGNFWMYLAVVGPILGEGDLGGFEYADGRREPWVYRDRKIYWNQEFREESMVNKALYRPKGTMPVALLTSPATQAAGELMLVAFAGRPDVRTFGEPTRGLPTLLMHTMLSDGSWIYISGANSYDRNGRLYGSSIQPDEPVANHWAAYGTGEDPVIRAAQDWLLSQPACTH